MTDQNPYQPPSTRVEDPVIAHPTVLTVPRKNPAGHGWAWIRDGFGMFAKSPAIWIVNIIILFVIIVVLSLLPIISLATYILMPIFLGGLMLGCQALDTKQVLTVGHLFEGFQKNTGKLAMVGLLYTVGSLLIFVVAAVLLFAFGGGEIFSALGETQPSPEQITALMTTGGIALLAVLALSIPLAMAIWFAPVLVVNHDLNALEAMKLSFRGCVTNIVPFLIFSIIVLIISIIAVIPFGLGLLVAWPAFIASIYVAYKDIFVK